MGVPTIYYDTSKTVVFSESLSGYEYRRVVDVSDVRSRGGVTERDVRNAYDAVSIGLATWAGTSLYDQLVRWWAWASRGKSWALAIDADDRVDTTLGAGASAGATSLTVASATGITAGRRYRVRAVDGLTEEIVTVDAGYGGGTTVALAAALGYAYASGAIFRSVDYFPALEVDGVTEQPFALRETIYYSFAVTAREYRS